MKQRLELVGSLAAMCFAAHLGAACADDTRAPSPADYDDTARALSAWMGGSAHGEVTFIADATLSAKGSASVSTDFAFLGVEASLDVACSTVGGVQIACEEGASNADVDVFFDGGLDLPGLSASATYDAAWALSDLDTDQPALNGSATADFQSARTTWFGDKRQLALGYNATFNGLRVDTTAKRPIDGLVSYNVFFDRLVEQSDGEISYSLTIDATASFSPDGPVVLTLDGHRTYHVDLDGGEVVHIGN